MTVDIDPEDATVGGLLLAPRLLEQVRDWLHPADFRRGQCGEVYQVLLDMRAAARPIDAVLVLAELRATGRLDRGGFLARWVATGAAARRRRSRSSTGCSLG